MSARRVELNKYMRDMPLAEVRKLVDRYRAELLRTHRRGGDAGADIDLVDHVDVLLDLHREVEVHLAQGVDDYFAPSVCGRLGRACDEAAELGLEVERFRSQERRLQKELYRRELADALWEIDDGERPPERHRRWVEIVRLVERCAGLGLEVGAAHAALKRARYVERCWARGVDPEDDEVDDDLGADSDDYVDMNVLDDDDAELYRLQNVAALEAVRSGDRPPRQGRHTRLDGSGVIRWPATRRSLGVTGR